AGGRGRLARVRARGRRAGADLLRLRRPRDRFEAGGLAGEGRDLRRLVAAARQADGDARDARRRGTVRGRARDRMEPRAARGGGAVGATMVFAEGAPDWPDARPWSLVESERVTMPGCSPTLVRALIPKGEPAADVSTLRAICTTGEPWNPDPYMWLFEKVGRS